VSFASADWLDKLSGPGPFKELFTGYRFGCVTVGSDQKTRVNWLRPWERTATVIPRRVPFFDREIEQLATAKGGPDKITEEDRRKVEASVGCRSDQKVQGYLIATYFFNKGIGDFDNGTDDNDLVAEGPDLKADGPDVKHVGIQGFELAYFNRLNGAFDLGLGFGFKHFTGLAFGSLNKAYLAPSLEFAPGAVAGNGPSAHVVKLVLGAKIFLGEFKSSDFCKPERSTPDHPFTCANPAWRSNGHYEVVPTIGLIIDTSVF
jgi:hypothetical protein